MQDENGVIYKFGYFPEQNDYFNYREHNLSDMYTTGWMLYKIVLPGSDEITFTYTTRDLDKRSGFYRTDNIYDHLYYHYIVGSPPNVFAPFEFDKDAHLEYNWTQGFGGYDIQNRSYLPLSINTSNASIIFSYQGTNSWNINEVNIL